MEFNVAQLLKQPVGETRSFEVIDEGEEQATVIRSIRGNVHFTRTNNGILVRANLDGIVDCECGRCLEQAACPVHVEIEEEYFPIVDVYSGVALPLPEDKSAFTISENHILDLTEAVRQYALMNLPMQPLCSPECQGLCSQCGANLNAGACSCGEPSLDPRLSKLAILVPLIESVSQEEKGVE